MAHSYCIRVLRDDVKHYYISNKNTFFSSEKWKTVIVKCLKNNFVKYSYGGKSCLLVSLYSRWVYFTRICSIKIELVLFIESKINTKSNWDIYRSYVCRYYLFLSLCLGACCICMWKQNKLFIINLNDIFNLTLELLPIKMVLNFNITIINVNGIRCFEQLCLLDFFFF